MLLPSVIALASHGIDMSGWDRLLSWPATARLVIRRVSWLIRIGLLVEPTIVLFQTFTLSVLAISRPS